MFENFRWRDTDTPAEQLNNYELCYFKTTDSSIWIRYKLDNICFDQKITMTPYEKILEQKVKDLEERLKRIEDKL
jgi:hypothetical protein